ncbi:MAG: cell division protein FtsQ/DivIB [Bulleidia sp.]
MQVRRRKPETPVEEYPQTVEQVFENKRKMNSLASFEKAKPVILKWAVLCSILCSIALYCLTPESRVQSIRIEGNRYLSENHVRDIMDLSVEDIYYAEIPFVLEWKLKQEPLVESADVSWQNHGIIDVKITEKQPVGYRYEDEARLLLSDGSEIPLDGEYLSVIADVPYVTGFTDAEQTRLLCKALSQLDREVIASIAEIHQYALEYDDEAMKILMRTGGYYIGTYTNLDKLKYYDEIYSAQPDHSYCIWGFDSGSTAFSQKCPWDESGRTVEYWTDASGQVLKNEYGDPVEKHYYVDSKGNTAVDGAGNPIPIPIDERHNEVPDSDFIAHYEAGYYTTGTLVMP